MRASPNAGGAWSQQRSSRATSSGRSGRSSHSHRVPSPVSPSTSARSSSGISIGGRSGVQCSGSSIRRSPTARSGRRSRSSLVNASATSATSRSESSRRRTCAAAERAARAASARARASTAARAGRAAAASDSSWATHLLGATGRTRRRERQRRRGQQWHHHRAGDPDTDRRELPRRLHRGRVASASITATTSLPTAERTPSTSNSSTASRVEARSATSDRRVAVASACAATLGEQRGLALAAAAVDELVDVADHGRPERDRRDDRGAGCEQVEDGVVLQCDRAGRCGGADAERGDRPDERRALTRPAPAEREGQPPGRGQANQSEDRRGDPREQADVTRHPAPSVPPDPDDVSPASQGESLPFGTMADDRIPTRRLLLARPRGYCAGVERAVDTVERLLEQHGPPVYVRKQIVHNIHVVRRLEQRGAIFVESRAGRARGRDLRALRARRGARGLPERIRAQPPHRRRDVSARHEGAQGGSPLRGERLHDLPRRPRGARGGRRYEGRGARRDHARRERRRCRGARRRSTPSASPT